jgi:hypothetical protein
LSVCQAIKRQGKVSEENHKSHHTVSKFLDSSNASNYYGNNNSLHSDNVTVDSNVSFNFANVQTKLKVSQPGDIYEQEADRVAERVMRMSVQKEDILSERG